MRRIFAWAMIAALSGLMGTAQAGSIVVDTASGSVGGVTFTNEGISGGTATILISNIPNTQSFLNNVNGLTVTPDPAEVQGPITLLVTPTGTPGSYNLALSPPTFLTVFGTTPGAQGVLAFNQTAGEAPVFSPTFFNMSGEITALISNLEPTYDFSRMPGGTMNFTFTGTTFIGTSSFNGLFSTPGARVVASGSFSMSSVPEPASMVMMGLGIGIVFFVMAIRRRKLLMVG